MGWNKELYICWRLEKQSVRGLTLQFCTPEPMERKSWGWEHAPHPQLFCMFILSTNTSLVSDLLIYRGNYTSAGKPFSMAPSFHLQLPTFGMYQAACKLAGIIMQWAETRSFTLVGVSKSKVSVDWPSNFARLSQWKENLEAGNMFLILNCSAVSFSSQILPWPFDISW